MLAQYIDTVYLRVLLTPVSNYALIAIIALSILLRIIFVSLLLIVRPRLRRTVNSIVLVDRVQEKVQEGRG